MKALLLFIIKIYWKLIPKAKRRPCIFRTSCSDYVYHKTTKEGFFEGLRALRYRFMNCRSGFHLFEHPNGKVSMILRNGQMLSQEEISERFINNVDQGLQTVATGGNTNKLFNS